MATRTFTGGAPSTRLDGGITGTPATFSVVLNGGGGFPTVGPFVIVIDRNLASEEKILCSSRTGDVFTVTTRGFDNTSQQDHADQAEVEHVIDAAVLTFLVAHADNDPADPHDQYELEADFQTDFDTAHGAADHVATTTIPHTWAVGADVRVPSGDTDFIPPFFVPVPAGKTVTLTRARHRINSGTSATVKLQKNGVDITGWTGIVVNTTTSTTDAADATFADGDQLALVVTTVSGTPRNMSFTLYLQYSEV